MREKYLDWDTTFLSIAKIVSLRSKDPSTQVGACIVDRNNRVLSVGYNGATKGFDDHVFPWGKDSTDLCQTKYPYVVHAEQNAILNFRGDNNAFEGATLYVTHFPCNECAKSIAQSGIAEVVYETKYVKSPELFSASNIILSKAGVNVRELKVVLKELLEEMEENNV